MAANRHMAVSISVSEKAKNQGKSIVKRTIINKMFISKLSW